MKKAVNFIDDDATDRNTKWLIGRRDPKRPGKFQMNPKHVDSFGAASQDITDAYIIWVLTQDNKFNQEDLQDEFDNLDKIA